MKWFAGGVAAVAAVVAVAGVSAQDKTALVSERDKVSYAIGLDVARSFEPVSQFIDLPAFERAIRNAFSGGQPLMTEEEATATDQALRLNIAASQGAPIPGQPPGSVPPAVNKEKVGLMLGGFAVGPSLVPLKDDVDLAVLMQALRTTFDKKPSLLGEQEAQATMQAFITKRQSGVAEENRAKGAAFLQGNKSQKGVVTTPSGLQYMVLREGSGARPLPSSRVRVNYEGKLLDGTVFDSSYQRGQPAEFGLNQVIPGWTEGVGLMPVGSKYRFWIPSELAYGDGGAPGGLIGPNATLTFDVELLAIQP